MPTIEIRMERDFDTFGKEQMDNFFAAISDLTGASIPELALGSFHRGCVIYRGKLTDEQARKLLELFQLLGIQNHDNNSDLNTPLEIHGYLDFIVTNSVISIRNLDQDKYIRTSKTHSDRPSIVFVHGWSSSPSGFGDLPKKLAKKTGLATLSLHYPTGKFGGYPGLISLAQYLDNEIAVNTRDTRNLIIVGHSMGGLLARRLLVGSTDGTALWEKQVKQLTLIASPGVGSSLATVANIATLFTQKQLRDLSKDSTFMQDLGPRWTSWMRRNVPNHVRVRAIYGERDQVVPRSEAMLFDDRPVPVLDGDHSTVVNPITEEGKNSLVNTLEQFFAEANLI